MRSTYKILIVVALGLSSSWADLDCPAETAVQIDTRTMLPDGSVNPTYDQEIETGLCGCLGFADGVTLDGNQITFSVQIVDNEPIRGIELNIYHDTDLLTYVGVTKGQKLENVTDSDGAPRNMTLIDNYLEDYLKILAYSTSQAQTSGDGVEGTLLLITYELTEGASLPEQVEFYFGLANLPGTSAQPELLNVVCDYPNSDNPAIVSTEALSIHGNLAIPEEFALLQNYPNPFNPSTKIKYSLASDEFVNITIFDLMGRRIKSLVNKNQTIGRYLITWDSTNSFGELVPGGMYLYTIKAGRFQSTKKMVLLK